MNIFFKITSIRKLVIKYCQKAFKFLRNCNSTSMLRNFALQEILQFVGKKIAHCNFIFIRRFSQLYDYIGYILFIHLDCIRGYSVKVHLISEEI